MKLFHVMTKVDEFEGCRDVVFQWFYNEDRQPGERPYAELIKGLDPNDDVCAHGCIDEMFSEEEALRVKEYLDQTHPGTHTILEKELPISNTVLGFGEVPVGGGTDLYMLDKTPGYSLPFKVWGYFDLRGCELVDGGGVTFDAKDFQFNPRSGELRARLWVRGPDGIVRTSICVNRENWVR